MPVDADLLMHRVSDAREAMAELARLATKRVEDMSRDERYSMRYNVIVLVEALASIAVHLSVEWLGHTPRSYSEAIMLVAEALGVECVEDLVALVRLRNLLVHRYWVIDDSRIVDSVRRDFRCVEEFINAVSGRFLGRGKVREA